MQGFDYDRAKTALGIPDGFRIEAMAAVGKPGQKEALPDRAAESVNRPTIAENSRARSVKVHSAFKTL